MFERAKLLLGEEKFTLLQSKTVLVVGLGGVGGHAAEALVRSGIGHVILVDQDIIEPSNINRQIIALHSTVGKVKVDVMKERLLDINPECDVITHHLFYNDNTKETIWNHPIDFVCDCIDTITYKIDLMKEAISRNIPRISVMGTGNKTHPELLELSTLEKTVYDPIARVMRGKLKTYNMKQIPVVFSKEQPLAIQCETISSLATVPSVAGIIAASYIINQLIS